ncbi:hypothetical protein [Nocardiopsis alba]
MNDDSTRGGVTPRRTGWIAGAALVATAVALLTAGCPGSGDGGGGGGGYGTVEGEIHARESAPTDHR